MHAHQRRRACIRRTAQQRVVQRAGHPVAVGVQPERTVRRVDVARIDPFDRVLGVQAMPDQVLDRTDLQPVLARERLELGPARHAAVGIEDLDQHPRRLQACEQRQVAGRLGVPRPVEYATGLRLQREDMPGLRQVFRRRIRPDRGADRVRAVVRRDAGGDALGGLDADREVGAVRRRVVAHHRWQAELAAALARQRQADQPARVGHHEVDIRGLHQLRGHDQVALVLAVLVVHDHDHAAGADFLEQFVDGGEAHA